MKAIMFKKPRTTRIKSILIQNICKHTDMVDIA